MKRTERGWAGHFIVAERCIFRRNTLLEEGSLRLVVSTVGLMLDYHAKNERKFEQIGCDRHFETMVFHAKWDGRYWDADVSKQVYFDSPWAIAEQDADDRANNMHEFVVDELIVKMMNGLIEEGE